jgi:calreticulin
MRFFVLLLSFCLFYVTLGEVYFKETFGDDWESHWVEPTQWHEAEKMGKWRHTEGLYFGKEGDKGIQTSEDGRFYGISADMGVDVSNEGKDLVLQYTVKNENRIDCAGAYIKLLGPSIDQDAFGGDTPYQIMFGPDICGPSNQKTHVIFHYPKKDENLLINSKVKVETDQLSHVYTLHVRADNTYQVLIDFETVKEGSLAEDFDFLLPEKINDPDAEKPADWVDEAMIDDPEDVKPEGWDDIPPEIPDPDAERPEDWDEDEDGEWEPPLIDNPDYEGPWQARRIPNPDYKGEWEHPQIPNPDYEPDDKLHFRCDRCRYVGFELWQVKSGSLFDDIIVTDSLDEARAFADETFFAKQAQERAMKEEEEEREREEMLKQLEEEEKAIMDAEEEEEVEEEEGVEEHEEL